MQPAHRGSGIVIGMRWNPGRRSDQLEDRRAQGASGGGGGLPGGGLQLLVFLFRRFGIVGVLVGAAGLYFLSRTGSDDRGARLSADRGAGSSDLAREEPEVQFVSFVLDDAQGTWAQLLSRGPTPYRLARLVLFRGATRSECGLGKSEMGPFYCQRDEKVYLDLGFFDALRTRFGAAGDFAQAYVIAHELGHHVQNILGAFERTRGSEQEGPRGASVRLELQADCYAGVWGHSAQQRQVLEAGDLEEALKAASVIGDDALQRQSSGSVRPETFTHGTSAQRARWFRRGFESGDPADCDTFAARKL